MLPKLFPGLLALATCSLLGCKKDTPVRCYAGTVVGGTCTDGVLIDVDAGYGLGAPAEVRRSGTVGFRNVIAAVNLPLPTNGGTFTIGQRLFFTYANDPKRQQQSFCYALDGIKDPVPHLVLNNVSTAACEPAGTN